MMITDGNLALRSNGWPDNLLWAKTVCVKVIKEREEWMREWMGAQCINGKLSVTQTVTQLSLNSVRGEWKWYAYGYGCGCGCASQVEMVHMSIT